MASLLSSTRAPTCMSCMRRVSIDAWLSPSRQQIRGKKQVAKATAVNVRLLADIPRYGRQGAIIPIPAGRMRNEFYPKRLAEYMTKSQLREVGMENIQSERDSTFGMYKPKAAAAPEKEERVEVEIDLLRPERAMAVLAMLLPANIDFYRTPIATPAATPQRHSPSIPTSSALSAAALEGVEPESPSKVSIYGSVTTSDIASNLKAILAEDEEGARVVLSPEEILFVEEGEEYDRVKHLGVFEIDIRVKGATDVIRRTIKVNAQE